MNKTYPSISVVMPVKNEAAKIKACIDGILSQNIPVLEIIVVDSGSTDGTTDILQQYEKVKLLQIPSAEFNHGDTRNYGVSHANGEFVVLTVGDARAYNNQWIENLLDGFDDEKVAAVCGQQVVPHDTDKNPIQWFRPYTEPVKRKYSFSKEEFEALSPEEKKAVCSWDDVTAMYRLSALKEIPFQRTSYCEDAIWAKEAILAGKTIVYNPAARVYHFHLEDKDFTFKVALTGMYFKYKQLKFIYPPPTLSLRQRLSFIKLLAKANNVPVRKKLDWYRYNVDQHKATQEAYKVFIDSLNKSEAELDKVHQTICGKPPIPVKAI